jgi:putative ABC transport system permease protein
MLDAMTQDLRYAVRMLVRSPGVTVVAVLTLGLGIGAVTTTYSTASAFTFRPLPQLRDPARLVVVAEAPARAPASSDEMSKGAFRDLAAQPGLFSAVTAFQGWEGNVAGDDVPEHVRGGLVTAGFLRVVGRTPLLGRGFTEGEDVAGGPRVVLLGHGLWQRRFGADSTLVGRTVTINGAPALVIGVMPPDFTFPNGAQLWAPLQLGETDAASRRSRELLVLARRADGVSARQAGAGLAQFGARLAATWPDSRDWVLRAEPAESVFGRGPRPFMAAMLAGVALVLLIACANVANLLLAKATARRREIAMRLALGASRGRIVRQLLTESVLLALVGGALGVLLAQWGVAATAATVPTDLRLVIPGFSSLAVDRHALLAAAFVSIAAGFVFGLAPALTASRSDLVTALKDAARSESARGGVRRLRGALIASEIGLALALLASASLMVSSARRMVLSDPGFRTDGVLTMSVTLPGISYPDDADVVRFWDGLIDDLRAVPGIAAAAATTVLPLAWSERRTRVAREDQAQSRPEDLPVLGLRAVSDGYHAALGIPLVAGRGFQRDDAAGRPDVALLSSAAARKLWPDGRAVGRRIRVRGRWAEVVGVVRNVRGNVLLSDDPVSAVYVPAAQWPARDMVLTLRTGADPASLALPAQRVITARDPRLAGGDVAPMAQVVAGARSPQTATARSMIAGALIALLMAAVGTYSVIAHSVGQRTHEIGVRVALGATAGQVVRMVLRQAGAVAAIGIVGGVAGALVAGRGLRAILVDTDPADPVIIGGAVVTLAAVALLASWIPARRAARVDPMVALRAE